MSQLKDGLTRRQTAQNPALGRVLSYHSPDSFSIWGNDNVEVAFFPNQKEAIVISGDFETTFIENTDSAEDAVVQWENEQSTTDTTSR